MSRRGLVIGKFLPPHRGHHYLIDTARAQVDCLTIIVCGKMTDCIPVELRAAWLREVHPGVEVIVIEDRFPPDDSRLWAQLTVQWLGRAPDVVFTSEGYGAIYARWMGCDHVLVDLQRRHYPCSGTAILADPLGCWEYLEPCVRGYFARRICVVGAESTGTTTLARALAERYRTVCVPEYGREYWEQKHARGDASWSTDEFVHIASEQARREDVAARSADRLLILDTDAFATSIWHERYVGHWSGRVERVSAGRRVDLYLLTDIDIPFVQDGTRDGEHRRAWMHERFLTELAARRKRFVPVSGPHEERMACAVAAIDDLVRTSRGHHVPASRGAER